MAAIIKSTEIKPISATKHRVRIVIADDQDESEEPEQIVIDLEVECDGNPLFSAIQAECLHRALLIISDQRKEILPLARSMRA